jgi:hypothetical protein
MRMVRHQGGSHAGVDLISLQCSQDLTKRDVCVAVYEKRHPGGGGAWFLEQKPAVWGGWMVPASGESG